MKFDKLFFRHEDAVRLKSSDKAILVEFIRWSVHSKESTEKDSYITNKYFHDGVWWMQDSHDAWVKRLPWLSLRTIARYLDEICATGLIAKRSSGSTNGGREANFYRVREVDCQIDQGGLIANLAEVDCQIDQGLIANLASTSLSKNHTKNHTKNPRLSSWPDTDVFSAVFMNLNKLSICKAKFKTEDYRTWLQGLMDELNLTIDDLIRLSNEWQEHHNEATKKPTSPKSSFRTWARNNYNGKKGTNGHSRGKVEAIKSKPGSSDDDIDWDAFIKSRS